MNLGRKYLEFECTCCNFYRIDPFMKCRYSIMELNQIGFLFNLSDKDIDLQTEQEYTLEYHLIIMQASFSVLYVQENATVMARLGKHCH